MHCVAKRHYPRLCPIWRSIIRSPVLCASIWTGNWVQYPRYSHAGNQSLLFHKALRKADWKEVAPVSVSSIIAMSLGVLFLLSADPSFIWRGMGVLILLVTIIMMFGYRYTGQRRTLVGAATGSLAGAMSEFLACPPLLSPPYFHIISASPSRH